jgi:Zn-finger nucleic acid-binding protein
MFLCPKCNASLGEVGPSGILEEVCSRCHYKFQVLKGRLADCASEQVVLRRETPGQRAEYRRDYELRLELPDRYEVLSLWTTGPDDRIPVRRGDIVSFVHTMNGDRREDLLFITDHTTGEQFGLGRIGANARSRAALIALVLGIGTAIFTHIAGASATFIIVYSLVVTVGSMMLLSRKLAPMMSLPEEELAALAARQELLERKRQMVLQRDLIQADKREKSGTIARLRELQAKMRSVGLDAYQSRIETMDRAIATLGEQVSLDDRLLAAYARNISILEIEYETGAATTVLPTDAGTEISLKLDELRALEAQHADLSRELEANEEVERLLKNS